MKFFKKIAVISAILEEPQKCQEKFNNIVSRFIGNIRGRIGIPFEEGIYVISITVTGTLEEINSLTGKLGNVPGVVVKTAILKELDTHMCGIGPFIPHKDTPLAKEKGGTLEKTIIMLALIRLMLPKVFLPATTALGSIDSLGIEKVLNSGVNVVMPNLLPKDVREKCLNN